STRVGPRRPGPPDPLRRATILRLSPTRRHIRKPGSRAGGPTPAIRPPWPGPGPSCLPNVKESHCNPNESPLHVTPRQPIILPAPLEPAEFPEVPIFRSRYFSTELSRLFHRQGGATAGRGRPRIEIRTTIERGEVRWQRDWSWSAW